MELEGLPQLPSCAKHVWDWYLQLSAQRTYGMTANPITWGDLQAWSCLTGVKLRDWELQAILGIDQAERAALIRDT